MSLESRVSRDSFVVRLPTSADPAQFQQKLKELGDVSRLPAHPELLVLQLADAPQVDARESWDQVRDSLGGDVGVDPVFLDEDLAKRYPSGTITVRFPHPLSDTELTAWCERHRLRVMARNKYVPNQISFQPLDHARQFLPDLLAELRRESVVGMDVWPETLSHYQRG